FYLHSRACHSALHSFPTRRSSDLALRHALRIEREEQDVEALAAVRRGVRIELPLDPGFHPAPDDRGRETGHGAAGLERPPPRARRDHGAARPHAERLGERVAALAAVDL